MVLLTSVLLLIVFLLSYLLLSGYWEQIRKAEAGTRNIATLLQTQMYETLRHTDADLSTLVAGFPLEALEASAVSRFQDDIARRLSDRLIDVDWMDGLYVVDEKGGILYASTEVGGVRDLSERDYFKKLSVAPESGLVFSNILTSRVSNREVLVVARAIRGGDGRFRGLVLSQLDLGALKKQLSLLEIGKGGYVAMRRRDDHSLIVRWPESSSEVESRAYSVKHPFVTDMAEGLTEATVADGPTSEPELLNHVVSFKAIPNYPFYFVVGFDRGAVLSGWYRQVLLVSLTFLVLVTLVGELLRRLGRMRRREVVILSDLAVSESKFSELAQMVPVGISRFDLTGKCVFVNDRNLLITGRHRQDLTGNDWSAMIHPDDRLKAGALWRDSADGSRVRMGEYRLLKADGTIAHVIGEAKVEKSANGAITGFILAQTDISRLKAAEAELIQAKQQAEQANQAKTRFLTAASHDLRQPIQAINLFKDALSRTDLSDEQETIARFLSLSVDSLSGLLNSLLDISKLDAGMITPQIRRVELDSIFEVLDEEFSSLARQKRLRFKFFYPFNGPVLETDPGLLLSVLRNLIDNAFKYTPAGGVLVGFRRRGRRGLIQVWDTGIGIDPVFGDRPFDECFQIGNTAGDRARGLGIGLSIARRTARLLGGDVSFRSRVGRGSVFEIVVPVSDSPLAPRAYEMELEGVPSSKSDFVRFKGWRVMVIEDDPVVAKSIEMSLRSMGVSVEHFFNAEDALAAPSLFDADFYISDYVLPGMNGIDMLDLIRTRTKNGINAILITGEISQERMRQTDWSGWRVLVKPAGLTNLLSVMAEVVDSRRDSKTADAG